ncbi:radical SAM protein [Prosthecobacter sp.]|uniref:radical SAM/SPASM domain-containing protein n=1 Tax=Prosthecobacter sp. TaxID=1965333 RepID=UPI002ABB7D56|nr:radical SAM protein [Prosthecobacter sp.]MDZ4401087.1 radical SAM protein [Prosthecobacter sp.]
MNLPNLVSLFTRKALYQLERLRAMLIYPFHKKALISRLSAAMGNVNIETTNICNAKCVFCAYQYQTRPTGVMDMDLFRKIMADYIECGGGNLGFTPTVGEPLVDKHIIERIRYARSHPQIKTISMYSNMLTLHKLGAEELVTSGLSALTVSTSGFDREMYLRVYRSTMYEQMLKNVLEFAEINNRLGRPVQLFVDMRVDRPLNEVLSYPDYHRVVQAVSSENIGVKFRYDSWGGKISQDELTGNMKLRHNHQPKWSPCSELFFGPMVYWDGKVGGCNCRDVDARELVVGNVRDQHLADIWFGPGMQQLRKEFTTPKIKNLCLTCTHYNHLSVYLRKDTAEVLSNFTPCQRPLKVLPSPPVDQEIVV